jgi:2-oxoglutarate dehydrogenase E1 component
MDKSNSETLDAALARAKDETVVAMAHTASAAAPDAARVRPLTAVPAATLLELNAALLSWPSSFSVHPKLAKQLERRRESIAAAGGIDWGHAEALAFASLMRDGVSVRVSGQDAARGTFAHRHAVLHDYGGGGDYLPLRHLPGVRAAAFEIYNSPLTETAVMAFEYGFSTAAIDALVMWEAQFGDFVNVAQPIMDQFMFADFTKWGQESSLVLLLPHGYEGQGPEHSSARLERFLQSCAEGNMRVAYPSTPAQYFHILREQARVTPRRTLVLMQPKSLLRKPEAASRLADLAEGAFHSVIDDANVGSVQDVRRIVFCTGKIYYEIAAALASRGAEQRSKVAVVRVEELYPWPHDAVGAVVDRYPDVEEVVWAQEEPRNMGAWSYALPRLHASAGNMLKVTYVGRPERASTAEGYKAAHDLEQKRIVDAAVEVSVAGGARRRGSAVHS